MRRLSLCLVLLLSGCALYPAPESKPKPKPAPVPAPKPDDGIRLDLKDKVLPIRDALNGHANDAKLLAAYFDAFADVLQRDTDYVKTTAQLRDGISRSGSLLTQRSDYTEHPEVRKTLEAVLADELGKQSRELDSSLRKKAVESFRAFAWACREAE